MLESGFSMVMVATVKNEEANLFYLWGLLILWGGISGCQSSSGPVAVEWPSLWALRAVLEGVYGLAVGRRISEAAPAVCLSGGWQRLLLCQQQFIL